MARGRRRTQPPWGSLVFAGLCLLAALAVLVMLQHVDSMPHGSYVATPGQLTAPATASPHPPTATATATATPAR